MKKIVICISLFSILSVAEGTGEKIGKAVDQKVASAEKYTTSQKNKIQKDFQKQMNALENDIQELKQKSVKLKDSASQAANQQWNDQIDFLEKRKKEIANDIKNLKKSSGNAWDQMKNGIQDAFSKVHESYQKAKNEFHSESEK